MNKCIKCKSEKVINGEFKGIAGVEVKKEDCKWYQLDATVFKPACTLCLDCGHVEFIVPPEELKKCLRKI